MVRAGRLLALSLCAATAACPLVTGAHAAGQASAAARNACFTPQSLAARPGEAMVQKHVRTFDRYDTPGQALAPFTPVPEAMRGAIRRVELPKGKKLIALTLDLCEQTGEIAGYDGAIFDYLRASGVPATLFAGGKWMASHDERTRQLMTDPLFEIANHSAAHNNLRLLHGAALTKEIEAPQRVYERIRREHAASQCISGAGAANSPTARMSLFRFPYGACNAESLNAVNDAGLLAIQWDVSTGDPAPAQSAQAIAQAMLRNTRPGSIIIAHANGRGHHTAEALPLAIPKLRAAGFEFVTVSELLKAGRPVIEPRCYDSRPGDTDRYDNLFLAAAKTAKGVKAAQPAAPASAPAAARPAPAAETPAPASEPFGWMKKILPGGS